MENYSEKQVIDFSRNPKKSAPTNTEWGKIRNTIGIRDLKAVEFASEQNGVLDLKSYIVAWNKKAKETGMNTLQELAVAYYNNTQLCLTMEECELWILTLYWERTTRGLRAEYQVGEWLKEKRPYLKLKHTTGEFDNKYAIDFIDEENDLLFQVKPISSINDKRGNLIRDINKNKLYGKPVHWITYVWNFEAERAEQIKYQFTVDKDFKTK